MPYRPPGPERVQKAGRPARPEHTDTGDQEEERRSTARRWPGGRGVVLRVEGGGRAGSRAHPVTTSRTAAVAAALAGLVTPGVGLSIRGAPLASVHGSGGAGAPVPPPPAAGPAAARPEEMSASGRAGQAAVARQTT